MGLASKEQKTKSEPKGVKREPFTLRIPVETIENLPSGSCVIPDDQKGEKVAVCKEGKTIKIFTIVQEKKE
jgi:hypothetical protein